jgi:hypothetical protein
MAVSFENVLKRMAEVSSQNFPDQSLLIRKLDPRQRKALELFQRELWIRNHVRERLLKKAVLVGLS